MALNIDKALKFDKYIKKKCKLANAKLQALKRLSKYLTEDCKLAILRSYIVSHFTYCSPLLHFSSKYGRQKMEKIHYRGLCVTFNDYNSSYEELLHRSKSCSLEISREKSIVTEMYKCLKGLGPKYYKEIFTLQSRTSRRGPTFKLPRVRTTHYGLHSLRFSGPNLWNNLKVASKRAINIENFKKDLNNYKGTECKCAQCKA